MKLGWSEGAKAIGYVMLGAFAGILLVFSMLDGLGAFEEKEPLMLRPIQIQAPKEYIIISPTPVPTPRPDPNRKEA